MFPNNIVCLSDEELLFILNAIGEKGIPGLNRDILQSDTECNQKLMDMAGRVLIARDFIKSDGTKLEIAKELLGVVYATIYPKQMVYLTVQFANMQILHQGFFKVPEMLVTHTSTSRVNYFEVDTKSALTAEPIIQIIDESPIGDGQDGQQLTLTQKDLASIKQNEQSDTIKSYVPSDKRVVDKFSNTLKNVQVQITLQIAYQLNPEVKQTILTIISDNKVNWLVQADNPATDNVTLQSISHISFKQIIEEEFLNFATLDMTR